MRHNSDDRRRIAPPARRAWAVAASALAAALALVIGTAPAAAHTAPTTAPRALAANPRLGATDPAAAVTITLNLADRSSADLSRMVAGIYDPSSPNYHHYLTPAEFAARFGPPPAARASAEEVLRAAGLTPLPSASSQSVIARGTAKQVEALFGVRLDNYQTADGATYHAPNVAPHLPDALRGIAASVLGLNNRPIFQSAGLSASAAGHPAPRRLGPREIDQAYHFQPLHAAGLDGSGQTIAFVEIDTFKQADVDNYDQKFGLGTAPVQVIPVGGGSKPAKGVSETTLDIEVVHAIAPKATLLAYEGPADFASLATAIQQVVTDNRAQVLSISLGGCEAAVLQSQGAAFFDTLTTIFQQAAAQGITVLVASGDSGAYTCHQIDPTYDDLAISVPADNPYVTAVGGTALFLNDDGSYNFEAGWEGPMEASGGGGGLSLGYPLPEWQTGPGVNNQYSNGKRQVPDVAADSDPLSGYLIYDSTDPECAAAECWKSIGGTSAAAPLWGALVALANQQAAKNGKKTMGFINPALYRMGRGELGPSPFHDVTIGGNLYYQAAQGWDYSTGWGTPDAALVTQELLAALPTR